MNSDEDDEDDEYFNPIIYSPDPNSVWELWKYVLIE